MASTQSIESMANNSAFTSPLVIDATAGDVTYPGEFQYVKGLTENFECSYDIIGKWANDDAENVPKIGPLQGDGFTHDFTGKNLTIYSGGKVMINVLS